MLRLKNCFFLFSKDFKSYLKNIQIANIFISKNHLLFKVENLFKCYISINPKSFMDYKKKSLSNLSNDASYEEIDTRLASGWYVDSVDNTKKKKYRTKKVSFKISKKI